MTKLWRKAVLCAFDALILSAGFGTVLLLLSGGTVEPLRALLPLISAPLCALVYLMPPRARLPLTLVLAAASGALGWLLSPLTGAAHAGYTLVSLFLPLVALPLLGTRRMAVAQAFLLILQLAASLLIHAASLEAVRPVILAFGVGQVVLLLFYVNIMQLREQCGSAFSRMLPGNISMTAVAVAAVLLLANLTTVWNALKGAVLQAFRWITAFLNSLMDEGVSTPGGAGGGGFPPGIPQEEPAMFWVIVQHVISILIGIAALYLLYRALLKLPALLRRLWAVVSRLLRRYRDAVNADYTDELQSLEAAEERDERESPLKRMRRRLTPAPDWSRLDNRQRVREAYRRLNAKKHPDKSLTAREALVDVMGAPQLTDAYDRARYSTHVVTDAEAEAARRVVR